MYIYVSVYSMSQEMGFVEYGHGLIVGLYSYSHGVLNIGRLVSTLNNGYLVIIKKNNDYKAKHRIVPMCAYCKIVKSVSYPL